MGFNSAFKGLIYPKWTCFLLFEVTS